jgi:septal ring factor EnvC (AmiA/AmiB activator)
MSNASVKVACSLVLAASVFGLTATPAAAESVWERSHPRRDQVNDRLASLEHRITQERREGELTRSQARQLRREVRSVRQEERTMASLDHGHITRSEQRALNQQENAISRQIGR